MVLEGKGWEGNLAKQTAQILESARPVSNLFSCLSISGVRFTRPNAQCASIPWVRLSAKCAATDLLSGPRRTSSRHIVHGLLCILSCPKSLKIAKKELISCNPSYSLGRYNEYLPVTHLVDGEIK